MLKVSLILTTYNSKDNLKKTLASIELQDYENVEVVIKDGGSTDGTLDVIHEYKDSSKYIVIYESKADTGIYDAMNQGYALSSGDIVAFFNDVFLEPNAISKMVECINSESDCVGAHADLVYKEGENVVRKWHMGNGSIYCGWMPGHPTLFLKREIYEDYGLYDASYKIAADYEFMIRFLKDKRNELAYLPETIVSMFYGGTSNGGSGYFVSLKEGFRALRKNGVSYFGACWITGMRIFRVLCQFL